MISLAIQFDMDTCLYEIMASSPGMSPMPAGPRIFRAPPHPEVRWAHPTQAEAERDMRKVEKYLSGLPEKKMSKK